MHSRFFIEHITYGMAMKPKRQNLTIHDIAKEANVSVATVSRAMNPDTQAMVATETREQIIALAQRVNYVPNLAARNLRATSTKTIGFIIPHVPNVFISDYHSKIFAGVSNALIDSDYRLKLLALKPYVSQLDRHPFKTAEGIDGVIVDCWPWYFSKKASPDVPCVIINDPDESVKAHFVCADNIKGGEIAAQHLYENGHERIAVLTGHDWSTDSSLRLKGFKRFMSKVGTAVPQEMIFQANYEEADAAKVAEQIFLEKKKVTAFFCCNDNMALGVIRKLKQLGIKCPEEVSVIGFDDDARSQFSHPTLTTIRMHTSEIGKTAVDILISFLRGAYQGKFFHSETIVPVSLVERKSVGPAP